MKILREHINEKFTQDSDPIADMNIGMIHQIKLWMESKDIPFKDKNNALIYSAGFGKLDFVEYLLAAGADVHARDDYALRGASDNGHTEVIKLLLAAGADVHAGNDLALDWAKYKRHTEVVKVLKDHIAKEKRKKVKESVNEKFTQDSDPIADMNIGMIHQIKLWMESIGESFRNKDHALACSAAYGKLDFIEYLLAAGADVHTYDDYALRYASENGHTKVVKVLLAVGADVHANNDQALRGASKNGHTEVVKVLLTAGADIHTENDKILQWASKNGHTEVVKILLAAGADVHAMDDCALRYASENGHTKVVKVLKDHIAKEKRKKVKENVNEKFTEDSDPISDMGIGLNVKRNFDTHKELDQWIVDKLPYILKMNEIPKDIIKSENKWFPDKYGEKIGEYIIKYITVNNKEQTWFSWYRAGIQKILIEMGFET